MKSLFFMILLIGTWIITGIWSYKRLDPSNFLQVVVWLLIWQFLAGIAAVIFNFLAIHFSEK